MKTEILIRSKYRGKECTAMVIKIIIGVVVIAAIAVFAYKIDNPSK